MKLIGSLFLVSFMVGIVSAGERVPSLSFSTSAQHLSGKNQVAMGSRWFEQNAKDREMCFRMDLDLPLTEKSTFFSSVSSIQRIRTMSGDRRELSGSETWLTGTEYRVGIRFNLR